MAKIEIGEIIAKMDELNSSYASWWLCWRLLHEWLELQDPRSLISIGAEGQSCSWCGGDKELKMLCWDCRGDKCSNCAEQD